MNSMPSHIRKNDQVIIITGKDKGKTGRVLKIFSDENRLLVEKINLVKRHTKPSAKNRQGGIIEKEATIHASNVMLIDPKTGKRTRVANRYEGGKKLRVSKKSQEVITTK